MFWPNKKKIRFFDECLAILDFLRKWLLKYKEISKMWGLKTEIVRVIIRALGLVKKVLVKVSVKENEVPTEKNSSRASIFATKASYISN